MKNSEAESLKGGGSKSTNRIASYVLRSDNVVYTPSSIHSIAKLTMEWFSLLGQNLTWNFAHIQSQHSNYVKLECTVEIVPLCMCMTEANLAVAKYSPEYVGHMLWKTW